ncbi:MAG TPA: hypothetical protein PKI37_03155, partial [Candidatus Cloacimonas sp.]|nr:hypothetical protein [Candidatus Cloacimonas sp.]
MVDEDVNPPEKRQPISVFSVAKKSGKTTSSSFTRLTRTSNVRKNDILVVYEVDEDIKCSEKQHLLSVFSVFSVAKKTAEEPILPQPS